MSTIIERLARASAMTGLVAGSWALVMIAMPFVGPAGRQVAVVGDSGDAVRAVLAAGGAVVEVRGRAVLARSEAPGFVAALYREGAGLVIEGRIGAGCFGSAAVKAGA
jgi:phage terminase large subunit-like protein